MNEGVIKQRVQRRIVTISLLILIGKFIAYFVTNSVGILTDAMESIVNVVAGFISLYSLWYAAKPKDKEHPFGHGKIELISASIEGLLISIAGGLIIYKGVQRIFEPALIESLDIGIIVVAVAGAINYLLGVYSIRVGRKYNSVALVAGGRHLQSDTYSTIGLVAGLLLLYFTNVGWIDGALALVFGSIIIYTGVSILKGTVDNLMDRADEQTLEQMAKTITSQRQKGWIDIHNTKTIKYGSYIYIDCDLSLPWYYNIRQSHDECDLLTRSLTDKFSGRVQVSVHSDPCNDSLCPVCQVDDCPYRKHEFRQLQELTLTTITQSDEERE